MMDQRSETNLVGVHPVLCGVIRLAKQTPQGFVVVCGLRSFKDEEEAVATHHSETLHSRHFKNKQGWGCAVDVLPIIGGAVSFVKGQESIIFPPLLKQIKTASLALNTLVEFGAEWNTFKDWGHIQLSWKQYP